MSRVRQRFPSVRKSPDTMPLTFFAHQVPVIPLKCLKPRWFDGTALCIGSMAPDFVYALEGTPWLFSTHTLLAQLTWTLPLTTAATLVFRHVGAAPLGASLRGVL